MILTNVPVFPSEVSQPDVQSFLQTWGIAPAEISQGQASLAQVFLSPSSTLPAVGASGAIPGVLAADMVIVFQFFNGIASLARTRAAGSAFRWCPP